MFHLRRRKRDTTPRQLETTLSSVPFVQLHMSLYIFLRISTKHWVKKIIISIAYGDIYVTLYIIFTMTGWNRTVLTSITRISATGFLLTELSADFPPTFESARYPGHCLHSGCVPRQNFPSRVRNSICRLIWRKRNLFRLEPVSPVPERQLASRLGPGWTCFWDVRVSVERLPVPLHAYLQFCNWTNER